MEPHRLTGLIEALNNSGGVGNFASGFVAPQGFVIETLNEARSTSEEETEPDPIRQIPIHGVIMKKVPAIFGFLGVEATSTADTAAAIKAALLDETVESIELSIDSPGGTIAGVQPLADLIFEGAKIKPIHAKVSDMAASAAYWLGSQASSIEANAGAMVGSIGVYRVMVDSSARASKNGLKVHLVSSGEFKGAGAPGTELKPKHLEREQKTIDQAADLFAASIARGRGVDLMNVKEWATGETWFTDEARAMGLIDSVSSVDLPESVEKLEPAEFGGKGVEMEEQQQPAAVEKPDEADTMRAEIEALKQALELKNTELEASAAEGEAKESALKAVIEGQKEELIGQALESGQVLPAMVEQVRTFAAFCGDDVAKLGAFIGALPVQTRPVAVSEAPVKAAERAELNDSDQAVARLLRIAPEAMATGGEWRAINARGELLDNDGAIIATVKGN
jgi:signal peptide peptidase SppA